MIATVTLNPDLDVILTVNNLKMNQYNKVLDACITSGGKGINVSKAVRGCGEVYEVYNEEGAIYNF
jgi:fructose-1-phosphate kinase PfkB-like protein